MDETHLSMDVARMMEILEEEGVKYCLGPMGTGLEGSWNQVMPAIRACHESMLKNHSRVITTITIDDRTDPQHHLDDIVPVVERRLGRKAKHTLEPVRANDLD
jgi:uncharacterized protein (TIGR00106 family)